jgi:mycothiol synthase
MENSIINPAPPSLAGLIWRPISLADLAALVELAEECRLADQFFRAYHASFRERPGFPGWSAAEWIGGRIDDENAKPEWSLLARAG